MRPLRFAIVILALGCLLGATAATQPAVDVRWVTTLDEGYLQSQRTNQPMLVFVADPGDPSSARALDSIRSALTPALAEDFVFVRLNPADSRHAMRFLGVATLPALRVLTPAGRVAAGQDDVPGDLAMTDWLTRAANSARPSPPASTRGQFVADLSDTDAAVRERAIRQLIPDRGAAPLVAPLLFDAKLRIRLAALTLLEKWNAPLTGIDPWSRSTLTSLRRAMLEAWAKSPGPLLPATRPQDLAQAGIALDAMLSAPTDAEARAMREEVLRFGEAILPNVDARLAIATTDTARQRLRALRYRLVATDRLANDWPDGFDRLASSDPFIRRAAVDELAQHVDGSDARLLTELFTDDDPFLRERGLRILGQLHVPQTDRALLRLLADRQPNVRAAVLKTFWEEIAGAGSSDPAALAAGLAQYVKSEKNTDLIVQCIRVLEKVQGDVSIDCIGSFLDHPQWRVRAEAADAIQQKLLARETFDPGRTSSLIAALSRHLNDPDGFVASQSAIALVRFNDNGANQAVLKALDLHPAMAIDLLGLVRLDQQLGVMILPAVRKLVMNPDPRLRITAIQTICGMAPNTAGDVIGAGLGDPDADVRKAVVTGFASAIAAIFPTGGRLYATPNDYNSVTTVDVRQWVAAFIAGTGRPRWMTPLKPKLVSLLSSPDEQTRVAAAVCLCALGDADRAWPVIWKSAGSELTHVTASKALPWLDWDKRSALFHQLLAIAPDGQMNELTEQFADVPDPRAAPALWQLLEDPNRLKILSSVASALMSAYGIQENDANASGSFSRFTADAAPILEKGHELQKLTALFIYYQGDPDRAAALALAVMRDKSNSGALRSDAMNVALYTAPVESTESLAVKSIADPALRNSAIQFLCGNQGLSLRDQLYIYRRQPDGVSYEFGSIIPVHVPAGLSAEAILPALADPDPDTAARAGYLLCLLGDHRGLQPLLDGAHSHGWDDDNWREMVYKAIAKLDDDSQAPVLEEIFKSFSRDDSDAFALKTFYWTIRAMHGPNILKLRKQIRTEIGTMNLI